MHRTHFKYLLLLILVLSPVSSIGENTMDPAPADWPKYEYQRKPGEFKRTPSGLIDPSPDVLSLQYLPKDSYGFVDWVKSIKDGVITPRESMAEINKVIKDEDKAIYNKDVLIKSKMDFMPDVIFPHAQHNVWLKCSNCHPKIFKMKAGVNNISMAGIWKGQFCGRCHDKVAFPTRNCFKCHSVPREKK